MSVLLTNSSFRSLTQYSLTAEPIAENRLAENRKSQAKVNQFAQRHAQALTREITTGALRDVQIASFDGAQGAEFLRSYAMARKQFQRIQERGGFKRWLGFFDTSKTKADLTTAFSAVDSKISLAAKAHVLQVLRESDELPDYILPLMEIYREDKEFLDLALRHLAIKDPQAFLANTAIFYRPGVFTTAQQQIHAAYLPTEHRAAFIARFKLDAGAVADIALNLNATISDLIKQVTLREGGGALQGFCYAYSLTQLSPLDHIKSETQAEKFARARIWQGQYIANENIASFAGFEESRALFRAVPQQDLAAELSRNLAANKNGKFMLHCRNEQTFEGHAIGISLEELSFYDSNHFDPILGRYVPLRKTFASAEELAHGLNRHIALTYGNRFPQFNLSLLTPR